MLLGELSVLLQVHYKFDMIVIISEIIRHFHSLHEYKSLIISPIIDYHVKFVRNLFVVKTVVL